MTSAPIQDPIIGQDGRVTVAWARWFTALNAALGGFGDVTGPATSTDNAVARWDGTGGATLKDSGVIVDGSNNVTGLGTLNTRTIANWVDGPASATDSAVALFDGTGGKLLKNSSTLIQNNVWTPALAGSSTPGTQTYTSRGGRYFKFGKLVYVVGQMIIGTKDGTTAGNLLVSGLPFPVETSSTESPLATLAYSGIVLNAAGGYYAAFGLFNSNASTISLFEHGNNVAAANLVAADFANGSVIAVAGCYLAAS